jgi:hypothetical protein
MFKQAESCKRVNAPAGNASNLTNRHILGQLQHRATCSPWNFYPASPTHCECCRPALPLRSQNNLRKLPHRHTSTPSNSGAAHLVQPFAAATTPLALVMR